MGGFEEKVRGVLSDTMNLPDDFLSMIPQYVAQNPVSLARASGTRITSGQKSSNVTTTGTTFAGGADILASPLTFTADGKTDFILRVSATAWSNSGTAASHVHINLDGSDVGIIAFNALSAAGALIDLGAAGIIAKPSSGSHTVNARLVVDAGTGTINSGTGGAGGFVPILVTLEVL